ncbi:MAG: pilus assembly protein [Candidatus Omnitrophota bacterium]|nr:pilus assembly protein [Candidatus Omnitrophota bacterium]
MFNFASLRRLSKQRSRGQSLVEFALVLPLFMLIAVAGIDVASLVSATHRLSAATREGARVATESTDAAFSTRTRDAAVTRTQRVLTDSGIPWWEADVNAEWNFEFIGGVRYDFLEVRAEFEPPFFFGQVLRFLGMDELPLAVRSQSVGYSTDSSQFFVLNF